MKEMKKKFVLGIVATLVLTAITAIPGTAHTENDSYMVTLWAGQNIDVGTVSVWNDAENLYVKYEATDNWYFTETHLHVATALENIPQTKKGNPIPGHFDYPMEYDPPVQENTNVINLEDCGFEVGDNLYIAAHAVVQKDIQEETAWGAGDNFPGKNWAMYFTYVVQIEQSIPD